MAKLSPTPLAAASSFSVPTDSRAKRLGLHESSLTNSSERTTTPAINREGDGTSRSETYDSVNFLAARMLMAEREDAGLTLEEAAAVSNCSVPTIWRRENAKCDLGALKQLVALKRAAGLKAVKGSK